MIDDNILEMLAKNFKLRNIEVECLNTLLDAQKYILNSIPKSSSIGIGHSLTLQNMNITELLKKRGNTVYDKQTAMTREEGKEIKRQALLTDWYISGSNAISVDGRIVNVDHSGNRVAALTFGPEKVIIVVGINKVVSNVAEAVKRVKNIACYKNAERAGFNPPCVKLHKCVDCVSPERVCNTLSIIEGQSDINRMKLIIVNEELGY